MFAAIIRAAMLMSVPIRVQIFLWVHWPTASYEHYGIGHTIISTNCI